MQYGGKKRARRGILVGLFSGVHLFVANSSRPRNFFGKVAWRDVQYLTQVNCELGGNGLSSCLQHSQEEQNYGLHRILELFVPLPVS